MRRKGRCLKTLLIVFDIDNLKRATYYMNVGSSKLEESSRWIQINY